MITLTLTVPRLNRAADSPPPRVRISKQQKSPWVYVAKKFGKIAPHFWPRRNLRLQTQAVLCVVLLALGRLVNIYVPIFNKRVVDSLQAGRPEFRVDLIVVYVVLKSLQGGGTDGMGILNNIRSMCWLRVQQYTTRNIRIALLAHLHDLSLRWHFGRKTGEVLRLMDRGTESINNLMNYLVFVILPTIVDIVIAIFFFAITFNILFGLIILFTMLIYFVATVAITELRTKYKRRMNLADNATRAQSVDSLLNFETVKYYGNEDYEVEAFRETITKFQGEEWKVNVTLNGLKTLQNVIVNVGLLVGSLLCAYLVAVKYQLTAGDYVLFSTYVLQLCVPLNSFGKYYITIQNAIVDLENMLDLLHEEVEIVNKKGATELNVVSGDIEFKNVYFGYDPHREVLKNISFSVRPTKTTALVGPSGSGKSTIIRLLFRFYDVTRGSILIDGQNVSDVTTRSLRRAIGVVPQDTVLFNSTIKYNILYGRRGATEREIMDAALQADIHRIILKLPKGYQTKVGERGLRLSGGEKQRVAIARTLLKAPQIVVLDEATSALDTQSERNIQNALKRVCHNRTTVIVAHRLSTIVHADEILVLKNGEIIERGTHESLMQQDGVYNMMWQQQLQTDEVGPDEKED
ncbi:ATP-binding cassette sub-family B member 6, mitochondrial-like isoform X1 [Photinus pyralis]|nr:ATP-binding cassette sub-family B member 6, mitochondrial-like isoform X1 [Photinus pyralis]XP_031331377.1 ATP-binding cassette sub-family B member 6, mitochondrial-like isoform X1 [Photinus pyralis]